MVKKGKSSLRVENRYLIAKYAWKNVNKALNTSIFKTSFKGKSGDREHPIVKKTYGMLLESAGNGTIKIGKSFPEHYLQQDFINRVKGKYNRIIQEEEKKKIKDEVKNKSIEQIKKEKKDEIKRLERIKLEGKINNLNNWLDRKCPGKKFIETEGKDYRLLIYRVVGPKDKIKLFCSKYYQPAFRDFIKIETSVKDEIDLRFDKTYHLQSIEKFLQKGIVNEPEFFRKMGPQWIDFETPGYVFERDEVNEIIDKFEENQFQFLIGKPSSGKTTIARNIGYKLSVKGWNVYHLSPLSFEIADIRNLKDEITPMESQDNKTLIIIEDIHKNIIDVIYLLERITCLKGIKFLLIGTSYVVNLLEESVIFNKCKTWEIGKETFLDAARSIGHNYIWIKYEKSQSKIRAVSIDFRQFIDSAGKITGCNFWILAYLLKAWDIERISYCIEIKNVYAEVKKDIEKLNNKFIEKYNLDDCIKTLLVLSPFSIYETGVPEYFLKDVFNVNLKTLRELIKLGEIEYQNGLYTIPHSALAQLYLETSMFKNKDYNFRYLLKDVRKDLNNYKSSEKIEQIPLGIIKSFLQTSPEDYGELLQMMCCHKYKSLLLRNGLYYLSDKDKTEISISIRDILFDKKTKTALIISIHEGDLKNFIKFLDGLKEITGENKLLNIIEQEGVAEFFESIDINILVSKIKNEPYMKYVMSFFDRLLYFKIRKFHRAILKEIDIHDLKSRIGNSDLNFEDTVRLICSIWVIDSELVNILKNTLIEKIKSTTNSKDIHTGLKILDSAEKEIKSKEVRDIIKQLYDMLPEKNTIE